MSVINVLNTAIYTKLAGGTVLTALLTNGTASIFYQQAKDNAVPPYVVWNHMAGGPTNDYPHDSRDQIVFVRGYSTVPALAGTIDAQISTLLHRGTLAVSGYTNWWLARETETALIENAPDGTKVYMAGAQYRIKLDV
jgi:hypothetical protein